MSRVSLLRRLNDSSLQRLKELEEEGSFIDRSAILRSILRSYDFFVDVPFGDVEFICNKFNVDIREFPSLFKKL